MGHDARGAGPPRRAHPLPVAEHGFFQIWDKDPACPPQMVGSTARGRRFSNFQAKLLAIGAALGFRQSQTSVDGFNEPVTALVRLQR